MGRMSFSRFSPKCRGGNFFYSCDDEGAESAMPRKERMPTHAEILVIERFKNPASTVPRLLYRGLDFPYCPNGQGYLRSAGAPSSRVVCERWVFSLRFAVWTAGWPILWRLLHSPASGWEVGLLFAVCFADPCFSYVRFSEAHRRPARVRRWGGRRGTRRGFRRLRGNP
jgi:hypothetical protein